MNLDEAFWRKEQEELAGVILLWLRRAAGNGSTTAFDDLPDLVSIDWNLINEQVRQWVERYTFDLVTGITNTSRDFIRDEISKWITSGAPLPELIDSIESSGMFGRMRAEMIGVTEVTRAYAEGNLIAWRQSNVVDGKRWNTAQDELVCPKCGPLAGKETNLYEPFQTDGGALETPPRHVRCRCWITPVVRL
jgi:SPP1 gp7 family putative phage head morphogenesis protein